MEPKTFDNQPKPQTCPQCGMDRREWRSNNSDTVTKEAEKARERAGELANSAWEKGREAWKETRNRGEEALTDVRERGEEAWEDAQKLVRKYPGRSIGIALLVGTVIGALIALRNDD